MEYGTIYILRLSEANKPFINISWKNAKTVPYEKYNIKESDFRVKTASFTTPHYYDLTTGLYIVLINSKYHENFGGFILESEYEEDNGLYQYECQDWSRLYTQKNEYVFNNVKLYNILRMLVSKGHIPVSKAKKSQLKEFKPYISGLRKKGKYDQSLYEGNGYSTNFFNQSISMIVRDKTLMETIRNIVYGTKGYYDVYFNDKGILQIEPISKSDWQNTGLVLEDGGYYNRKFKFSTNNAVTSVNVNSSDLKLGKEITMKDLTGLDLSAFFGNVGTSVADPNNNNTTKAVTTSKKKKKDKSKPNKYNNPFNNKPKRVWINADGGSDAMKKALAKSMKKHGWKVHTGITYSNAHYTDYFKVSKKYSVYATVYNGICAGTMREAYSSRIQNELKKKGVQLVIIFDTASWNNPSRHLKKHKYGDFKGCNIKRAWDDNFSGGDPSISDLDKFFRKHNAKYCASPTASQVMKQFLKGGYYKYKGIKV